MLRRRTARAAFAIASLTAALLLAGCSADDDPPIDEPTTQPAEETTTTTPTIAPVTLPVPSEAMATPDEAGAAAAAEYFVQLYDYSFASGDLAPWNALSGETCDFCRAIASDVAAIDQSANATILEPTTIVSSRVWMIEPAKWFGADLLVHESPSSQIDSEGDPVAVDDGGDFRLALALSWADGWTVDEVDVLDPDETPRW